MLDNMIIIRLLIYDNYKIWSLYDYFKFNLFVRLNIDSNCSISKNCSATSKSKKINESSFFILKSALNTEVENV